VGAEKADQVAFELKLSIPGPELRLELALSQWAKIFSQLRNNTTMFANTEAAHE
jgi:hypothetical protein